MLEFYHQNCSQGNFFVIIVFRPKTFNFSNSLPQRIPQSKATCHLPPPVVITFMMSSVHLMGGFPALHCPVRGRQLKASPNSMYPVHCHFYFYNPCIRNTAVTLGFSEFSVLSHKPWIKFYNSKKYVLIEITIINLLFLSFVRPIIESLKTYTWQ